MSRKTPGEVRARTCGTKSPSRSEALRFIDSSKCRWGFGWVDKAQCFRSARRFGAAGSSPDFSRGFSRHGAPRPLSWTFFQYPSLPFRRCFALVGDEPAAEDHQGRWTHAPSVPLWFFLRRRTKLSQNASPFLNDFPVYLGVKKLHGTYDSSFLEWRLDTFLFLIFLTCSVKFENRIRYSWL